MGKLSPDGQARCRSKARASVEFLKATRGTSTGRWRSLCACKIVAADHHYFSDLKTLGSFLSALLAILLWPLILLGTKFTINL